MDFPVKIAKSKSLFFYIIIKTAKDKVKIIVFKKGHYQPLKIMTGGLQIEWSVFHGVHLRGKGSF